MRNTKIFLLLLISFLQINPIRGQQYSPVLLNDAQYLPAGINLRPYGSNPMSGKWLLVLSDDFNGTGVNQSLWNVANSCPNFASNVQVTGGVCTLKTQRDDCTEFFPDINKSRTYVTSGADLSSKVNFERGMFEARIKFSSAYWAHDCFWIWDENGEIDIAEYYGSRQKEVDMALHNYYKDVPNTHSEFNKDHVRLYRRSTGNKANANWHVYRAIWDKYAIYFYIDDRLVYTQPKFHYSQFQYNYGSIASPNILYNQSATTAGYYLPQLPFFSINASGEVRLSTGIDQKHGDHNGGKPGSWYMRLMHGQFEDMGVNMEVDYARVYQRSECEETEVITNGKLLPYTYLSTPNHSIQPLHKFTSLKSIIFGTQDQSRTWQNIITRWDCGNYKAKVITLLPNFESTPRWNDPSPNDGDNTNGKYSAANFEARACADESQVTFNPPVEASPQPDQPDTNVVIDTFDCAKVDWSYVDTLISQGDTAELQIIYAFLDSLGCSRNSANKSDPSGFHSAFSESLTTLSISPNPNNGSFLILLDRRGTFNVQVYNNFGIQVYSTRIAGKTPNTIRLNNSPPGTYLISIRGEGISEQRRITTVP